MGLNEPPLRHALDADDSAYTTNWTKAPPTTTSPLLNLPMDIFDKILDPISKNNVCGHTYIRDMVSAANTFGQLSLTCKDIHAAVQPRLYETIIVNSNAYTTCQLVRSLCNNPKLALMIRHITAQPCTWGMYHTSGSFHDEHKVYSVTEMLKIYDKLQRGIDSEELFAKMIQGDFRSPYRPNQGACGGVEMMFVLMLAKNVQSVSIGTVGSMSWCPMQNEWGAALRTIWSDERRADGAFAQLEDVELDGMDYGVWDDHEPRHINPEGAISNVTGVMALPALKRLQLRGFAGCEDIDEAEWPFKKASSGLKMLSFPRSLPSTQAVRLLITTCAALDEFYLNVQRTYVDGYDAPPDKFINAQELFETLRLQQGSLRTLTVMNLDDAGRVWFNVGARDLSRFSQLESLEIDFQLLVDLNVMNHSPLASRLPRSLRDIKVHSYDTLDILGDVLLDLIPLHDQGLQHLEITFPSTTWIEDPRFRHGKWMSSMDRKFFIGQELYFNKRQHGHEERRIFMKCWDLQIWLKSELIELAHYIRHNGIDDIVRSQFPSVYEDVPELEECMLATFEEAVPESNVKDYMGSEEKSEDQVD